MPQHSYNQYEQHAAVKRCQQQDEDVFTEVIHADGLKPLIHQGVEAGCERLMSFETRAGDGARTHDSHVGNVALYH